MKNIKGKTRAVVLGHAVADALGVPVEFCDRAELDMKPVQEMLGYGTYPYPAGCWSDDTSMSLAALDSIADGRVDFDDIMIRLGEWYYRDGYTPTGKLFDVGNVCSRAIDNYFLNNIPAVECGPADEYSNGNGSLMRIHPFVLLTWSKGMEVSEWESLIAGASSLTHRHERSILGCLIYTEILLRLLDDPSKESVRPALVEASRRYADSPELRHYGRLFSEDFAELAREEIRSTGYVVDTLEAAVWCVLTTDSYRDCVLKAANLGEDTDTVAAVAGGLAGALYGYDAIPSEWLDTLKRREYIEQMCDRASEAWT